MTRVLAVLSIAGVAPARLRMLAAMWSTRTPMLALAVLLPLAACGKRKPEPRPAATTSASATVTPAGAPKAGALRPVVAGQAVIFAMPRPPGWWVAASLACYNAVSAASPGFSAMDMIAMQYPAVAGAMRAADLDLRTDVVAAGGFACGDEACMWAAAALRSPGKVGELLRQAGAGYRVVDPTHHAADIQGARGTRTLHLRVVPLDWTGVEPPEDAWARDARRATHVLFFYGVDAGRAEPDPLAALADATTAAQRLGEATALLPDARGLCVTGALAPDSEIRPGTRVTAARFAAAAPPRATGDVGAAALGSPRSIDLEVVLELAPAPTPAQVAGWIEEARAWIQATFAPLRPQLTVSLGPLGEQIVRALGVVAEAGFSHRLEGGSLRLSFTTRRITETQLRAAGL